MVFVIRSETASLAEYLGGETTQLDVSGRSLVFWGRVCVAKRKTQQQQTAASKLLNEFFKKKINKG